ncbi:PfkB family carbohydrate kinase [Paenibacillus naphthalenovorans]|uniref:PfkB family carbohydrate kinase n=1 Tax=Paenibacillus naphthalenovorans TaxID=162209 RepID=UPI003D2D61F8
MTSFVSVIGTIFVDCKGFPQKNYNPTGRNLGSIEFVHGGVGRNVAENMANLELPIAFVTTVDDTGLGEEIKKRLIRSGINTEYLKSTPSEGVGMWLAILDENGDFSRLNFTNA